MLILTRRVGERLRIGDDVVVDVISLAGNQVRIGVDAPREIAVHREEIYNKINGIADSNAKDRPRLNGSTNKFTNNPRCRDQQTANRGMATLVSEEHKLITHHHCGALEIGQIEKAISKSQLLPQMPVMWDLTKTVYPENPAFYATQINAILDRKMKKMTSSKRAIVVGGDSDQEFMEDVLGALTAPWPWVVFQDVKKATDWLIT